MSLDQRVRKLERENLWMRRGASLVLAAVGAFVLVAQGKEKKLPDVEVRSLSVRGDDGTVRAKLRAWKEGAELDLYDSSGKTRAALSTDGLHLYDSDGKLRATVSAGAPALRPSALTLYDSNRELRMLLSAGKDVTAFDLYDSDGSRRVLLSASKEAATLTLSDNNGKSRATLGSMTTVNKVTGAETKTAENTLTLFDAKGTVIWQAPR